MDPHKSKPKRGPPESLKSDWSKDWDVDFQRARMDRSSSEPQPGSECVSLKSDWSKDWDVDFKRARMDQSNSEPQPGSQCVSLKSDLSKDWDVDLKRSSEVPGPSLTCVSPKSDQFKDKGLLFKAAVPDQGLKLEPEGTSEECPHLDSVFARLEEEIMIFVKEQLKRFHRVLASDYPECSECENEEPSSREAVLNITLDFLKKMNQEDLAERLHSKSAGAVCSKLKRRLQQKFSYVFEGVAKAGNPAPLNQIYTELHITEGGAAEVNHEHEVRHIETAFMNEAAPETTIKCEDIFKGPAHREGPIRAELTERPIRTVLTKGVAGVGKTVLTQKFSLDWAEGRANQNLQLLFPFTFRELNMLRDTQFSLVELLHHFFSESKKLYSFQQLQVLFIFDGLDECRIPLDFGRTPVLTDPTESVSVGVLLVNLIRGSLLPSAHLWLTTRPAAASQIPAECVSMVTEVRGFTDLQKEHYFRKRFRNMRQATAVISHIKSIRSLHIMCHIPVFCWILCAVIQKLLEQTVDPKLPHTLTELYIHFLVVQAKVKNCKYDGRSETDPHWTPETREMVLSLGKLAFEQLQKGNLIFYECDLSECGLDAAEVARYSGVFTQVFREESGLYQDKVYCFIHLSVQEFLAALHVHLTFYNSGVNLLSTEQISERPRSEAAFYHSAVDKALQSPNGHLDLFLRFFLGLSLPTNQSLLPGLVTKTGSGSISEIGQETVKYIKKKLDEGLSSDRSLNLFHCLNELNDLSLVDQIQKNVRGGHFSDRQMSPADWSAVAFLLLSSDSYLEEFDLKKYQASEEVLLRLLPVIKASTKAIVAHCELTPHSCGLLASVLSSYSLTHLDLSNNDLQDPGVEQLCSGLRTAPCRLRTLKLSGCLVSERGGAYLASALSSAHSHLRELDLSYNHPGPSAELLTALRDDPHCPLVSLRLDPTGEQWMVPGLKKYACDFSLDPNTAHRKLRLSKNNRAVTHVEEDQQHPDHADRFKDQPQVLSSTGLTGRCYWEVDWSGEWVDIAVSYKGIHKITEDSRFGDNDQSWSLRMEGGLLVKYSVCHSGKETQVSSEWFLSGPVGVFLDVEAGSLSFYKVLSDGDLFHLYTFDSTFTEPLFPGFGLRSVGSSMTLIDSDVESVTTLSQSLKNLEKWSKSRGTD